MRISGDDTNGTVLTGNFIGTNPAGTAPLPNEIDGVVVSEATNTRIGGPNPGQNVISARSTDVLVTTGIDGGGEARFRKPDRHRCPGLMIWAYEQGMVLRSCDAGSKTSDFR